MSSTSSPSDVVLVLPTASSYTIYSLVEHPAEKPDATPFALKTHSTDTLPPALGPLVVRAPPPHLAHGNVDVIVSTRSGAGQALPFWTTVLEPLLELVGVARHRVLVTQSAESVRQFAHDKWAADSAPRNSTDSTNGDSVPKNPTNSTDAHTVVVLSGDGGVVDLLNGLTGRRPSCTTSPTLSIIPLGTANALFHSLHKPLNAPTTSTSTTDGTSTTSTSTASPLVLALRTLLLPSSTPAPLPLFCARFSPGAHLMHGNEHGRAVSALSGAIVASYGLHASIVWESDTPEYRQYGVRRFGMVAAELLRKSPAYRARVDVRRPDGSVFCAQPKTDAHAYVLATLVSNLEREFTISPASKPLDGRLRLVHFGAVSGDRTMDILMSAYRDGAHVGMRWDDGTPDGASVGYDEVAEVVVTMHDEDPRWRKVCVDGIIVEVPTGGSVTIAREAGAAFDVLVGTV